MLLLQYFYAFFILNKISCLLRTISNIQTIVWAFHLVLLQENVSEFDSSMMDDPGTPEYTLRNIKEEKVIISSPMKIKGKTKNDRWC